MAILTYQQQQTHKPISENNRRLFDQVNEDTYTLRIVPLFGDDFLIDVEENLTEADYKDLLFGSTYEISGIKYRHGGLLKVIAYFNYAEYSKTLGIEDTFTGYQKAVRGESQEANTGEKSEITRQAYAVANTEAERVKKYLDNNCDLFTKWRSTAVKTRVNNPQYIPLKKK